MLIAQFSDTHIKPPGRLAYGRVDTADLLARAVAHLRALPQRPDLLVITGDLVDLGGADEYQHLRALLAPLDRLPMLLVPGNHDDREALRAAFPEQPGAASEDGFWQFVFRARPLRLIGLDTVVPRASGGLLCARRLAWLESQLAQDPGAPTVLLMHHPPFVTGIGHMDEIGLAGREGLAQVLARHPQVERVLCGHLHRHIVAQVGGRLAMTAPSTAHTVQLDLATEAPAMFRLEPPGYLLHWWSGTQLVTHQVPVVPADCPYPFFDADGQLLNG